MGERAACSQEGGRGSGAAQELPSQSVGNSLQSHPSPSGTMLLFNGHFNIAVY